MRLLERTRSAFSRGLVGSVPSPGLFAIDLGLFWLWLRIVDRFHVDRGTPDSLLGFWASGLALAATCLGLHRREPAVHWSGVVWRAGGLSLGAAVLLYFADPTIRVGLLAWTGTAVASSIVLARLLLRSLRGTASPMEGLRWLALGALVGWTYSPYFHAGGVGAGDAYWYTVMLADFVTQLRAGIFPIWAGQTEFAFNGAVSPLRFAPWFQAAGGMLDLVTVRTLSPLEIRNALVILHAFAGAFSCYFCVARLIPRHGNLSLLLAAIYATCPGYLAPLFVGDQLMTSMTMPFLPLAALGLLDSGSNAKRADALLAIGLSGLWLAHAPIAMWATGAAGLGWLALRRRPWIWADLLKRAIRIGMIFFALGALPFFSIAALDNQFSAHLFGIHVYEQVLRWFPANFLPIDLTANRITLYQLGYASVLCAALAAGHWTLRRERESGLLLFVTAGFLVLTVPVPFLTRALWEAVPSAVISVNNVWPTQRLFAITTILVVFALGWQVSQGAWTARYWHRAILAALLFVGVGWSIFETSKFHRFANGGILPRAKAGTGIDPRNAVLTRYAYGAFATVPAYVSHGYMDPRFEHRLWSVDGSTLLASNAESAAPRFFVGSPPPHLLAAGVLHTGRSTGVPGWWVLSPKLTLPAGANCALRLDFARPDARGILILQAGQLFRQYALPDSGSGLNQQRSPRAFGSTPTSSHILSVQNLESRPVELELSFAAQGEPWAAQEDFGRYWLYSVQASDLPVAVQSLAPYHATVQAAQPTLLETPRVWMSRYRATVNGRSVPAVRTNEGLVGVPLESGRSAIGLELHAPWWLTAMCWITLAGWGAVLAWTFRALLRPLRATA